MGSTAPHRRRLLERYKRSYDDELATLQIFTDHGFDQPRAPLDAQELARAARTPGGEVPATSIPLDPERVISALQLA